jgi:hypothetical protein
VTVTLRNLTYAPLTFDGAGIQLDDYAWAPVTDPVGSVVEVPDDVRFSAAVIDAIARGKMSIIGEDALTPVLSAYDVAVENGFVGTEEEWLESLHGGPNVIALPYTDPWPPVAPIANTLYLRLAVS